MITILIVDDDKSLQHIFRKAFPMRNFEILGQAFDGVEAIELFTQLNPKPDVVIMDQRMPRMDGITATQKLKELNSGTKIIFVSADSCVKNQALAIGADTFLQKPVTLHTLFDTIRALLTPTPAPTERAYTNLTSPTETE